MKKRVRDLYDQKVTVTSVTKDGQTKTTEFIQPTNIIKKDLNDYKYSKNIDEKVLTLAMSLAEKFAVAIIRDTLNLQMDAVISQISSKVADELIKKMPAQQVIIRETVNASAAEARQTINDYDFSVNLPGRNHAEGLQLKGQAAKTTKTNESIDDTLDILDQLTK
jgi:hypothetical protein